MKEAFEQVALAMYNYMSEAEFVAIDPESTFEIEVEGKLLLFIQILGHDLESLLYNYMNEFLYHFSTEFIICKDISILDFDEENFKIRAQGYLLLCF